MGNNKKALLVCRTSLEFKSQLDEYARAKDMAISEIIRQSVTEFMKNQPLVRAWSVRVL